MGSRLMDEIREMDPERLVSDCLSCRIQFDQMVPYRVVHPIEILWESYAGLVSRSVTIPNSPSPHSSQSSPRSSSISGKGSACTLADWAYTPSSTQRPDSSRKSSKVLTIGSISQACNT